VIFTDPLKHIKIFKRAWQNHEDLASWNAGNQTDGTFQYFIILNHSWQCQDHQGVYHREFYDMLTIFSPATSESTYLRDIVLPDRFKMLREKAK
jgi:hypothetical protein